MKEGGRLLSLKALIDGSPGPIQGPQIYAQGWALCHYLRHGAYRKKFSAYLDAERKGDISFDSFLRVFSISNVEAFEKEFLKHIDAMK